MKSKIYFVTTIVLFFVLLTTLYFIYDLSNQKKEMADQIQQLDQQLVQTKEQLDQSTNQIELLKDEKTQISTELDNLNISFEDLQSDYEEKEAENETLQSNNDKLQLTYDELYQFTYCGDEFVELDMVYRSNDKASETLTQWVDDMWGDVKSSTWMDFWSPDAPGLHVVETGYTNNYFIVFFEQQDFFDAPNGVFMVSHHCWLDGGPKN